MGRAGKVLELACLDRQQEHDGPNGGHTLAKLCGEGDVASAIRFSREMELALERVPRLCTCPPAPTRGHLREHFGETGGHVRSDAGLRGEVEASELGDEEVLLVLKKAKRGAIISRYDFECRCH